MILVLASFIIIKYKDVVNEHYRFDITIFSNQSSGSKQPILEINSYTVFHGLGRPSENYFASKLIVFIKTT